MSSIADSLAPEVLEQLGSAFRLELEDMMAQVRSFGTVDIDDWIEDHLGMVTSEHLWHSMWLFGIVLDEDGGYYVPSDHLVEMELIELSGPNRADDPSLPEVATMELLA
jgi:hypothetical protein